MQPDFARRGMNYKGSDQSEGSAKCLTLLSAGDALVAHSIEGAQRTTAEPAEGLGTGKEQTAP